MNFKSLLILFFLCSNFFNLRAQLVLNNGVIVNVNGGTSGAPATLVLANPPATPIARLGTTTSQGVLLESEFNRIQYNLDQGTTSITVPYISNTTGSWVPFPFSMYGITAGTRQVGRTAAIRFSTTKAGTLATGWDNYNYRPSQVLNTCGASPGCVNNSNVNNNSQNVVDRFWIVEPVFYNSAAQRPGATFDFTYIMEETNTNSGNTAALANALHPQRFDTINTGSAIWGWNGFPSTAAEMGTNTPGAMTATGVGTLTNVSVSAANFFPDWVLASRLIPLPVTLLNFDGVCENYNTTLTWTTAEETNSQQFIIEKSKDGLYFKELARVAAAGSSMQNITYSYIDIEPTDNAISYYRLSQTDKDGSRKTFEKIIASSCANSGNESGDVYSYQGNVFLNLFSLSSQQVTVNAYDLAGRLVLKGEILVAEGFNHLEIQQQLAQGIYLFELNTNKQSKTKKILIEN